MTYKEKDIKHETEQGYWVLHDKPKKCYFVMKSGITHSQSDSAYPMDEDGLSIAIARANYLSKRAKGAKMTKLFKLPKPDVHVYAGQEFYHADTVRKVQIDTLQSVCDLLGAKAAMYEREGRKAINPNKRDDTHIHTERVRLLRETIEQIKGLNDAHDA